MHGNRVKDALHLGAADLALGHLIVADPLHDLELMALLAPVLVNGHRFREYSWHSGSQSAKDAGRSRRVPSTAAAHAV
jgi:hypothetical protein